jgi:hypothetical protein
MAQTASPERKKSKYALPKHLEDQVRAGTMTTQEAITAANREKALRPETPEQFLAMIGCEPNYVMHERKAAILGFASRQPGLVRKLPPDWIDSLKNDGCWPLNFELEAAIKAGEIIREHGYIRTPGSPN